MNTSLFPHQFRLIGWILLIPGAIIGVVYLITGFEWEFLTFHIPAALTGLHGLDSIMSVSTTEAESGMRSENFTNELVALLILTGSAFVAFSKEKVEDEYLVHLRLSALLWAVYINAVLSFLAILLLFGFNFLYFMMGNLFMVMLLFIGRYHWMLHSLNKASREE